MACGDGIAVVGAQKPSDAAAKHLPAQFIKLLDKLDAESKRTAEKDWDPAVDSTSKKALSKREAKLLQDEKQNTFGKKEQAQAIFASNCAAVLASSVKF